MTQVMCVVGACPQVMRRSEVPRCLDAMVDHVPIHTVQNDDCEPDEISFGELGLCGPNGILEVDTASLGRVLNESLIKTNDVPLRAKFGAVMVLRNTNNDNAAGTAKRWRTLTHTWRTPSDASTRASRRRRAGWRSSRPPSSSCTRSPRDVTLFGERIHPRSILLTGSPTNEILTDHRSTIDVLALEAGGYPPDSAHGDDNVNDLSRLLLRLDCLGAVDEEHGYPCWW